VFLIEYGKDRTGRSVCTSTFHYYYCRIYLIHATSTLIGQLLIQLDGDTGVSICGGNGYKSKVIYRLNPHSHLYHINGDAGTGPVVLILVFLLHLEDLLGKIETYFGV
jgi:hypothetical protein